MKITHGLHIGIDSASIARMKDGEPCIIKTDTLRDEISMCVYLNKKGAIQVGDAAFNALKNEKLNAIKNCYNNKNNAFIGFTRTLGTDKTYLSNNADKAFTSEELVAEVIKTLLSFEKNEQVKSAVITVPDNSKINQIDAIRKAGELAGLEQVEVIQKSIATAWVYGVNSENNDGFWLVFDFGGGTFDAALLKVTDGIRQVIDTEGDNYLGGKNLDEEIVDEIILPYLKENFVIDELLEDDNKRSILRAAMKFYAEEIKKQLSFNKEASILTNSDDIPGEDDEGEEFELDFTVTEAELEKAIGPVFQKSINISNKLLERNNLSGDKLSALILVGGPTYSPIVRRMLSQQICKPDTSFDPKLVIAKGAALYASTVDVSEELSEITRDKTKIQLEVGYELTTLEEEEFITIKILDNKTEGNIPETVFVEITRDDKAWSSGKVEISVFGEVIEVAIVDKMMNLFLISLIDDMGNSLLCEPNNFTIQKTRGIRSAVLPYNIGVELEDKQTGKLLFKTIKGLEKSKYLPATGVINSFKTDKPIRPGKDSDYIKIPIYQGDFGAENSRIIHNYHVCTILITGNDLPSFLPKNSVIDIQVKVDVNQKITGLATFPHLAFTYEFECETKVDSVNDSKAGYLETELSKAKRDINSLKSKGIDSADLRKTEKEVEEIENNFNENKDAPDTQQQTIESLRRILIRIDKLIIDSEWPWLEKELRKALHSLEEFNREKGNEQTTKLVESIRPNVEQVIRDKDTKHTSKLIEEINQIAFELEKLEIIKYKVESLLFHLTENEKLSGKKFGEYFEQISNLSENDLKLETIYKELRSYE